MSCAFAADPAKPPALSQIALPLGVAAPDQPRRIVVGSANAGVLAAFTHAAGWPFGTAILFGAPRSGKSLMASWFAESGQGDALDDADRLPESELFHRWNRAQQDRRSLLLTATAADDRSGQGWAIALPDLASRLAAALRLDIGAPDDAMMADLITAHAEARRLAMGADGARYLATRCERSHFAAERLVAIIDRLSLEHKQAPGAAIWREALEELSGPSQPRSS